MTYKRSKGKGNGKGNDNSKGKRMKKQQTLMIRHLRKFKNTWQNSQ